MRLVFLGAAGPATTVACSYLLLVTTFSVAAVAACLRLVAELAMASLCCRFSYAMHAAPALHSVFL